MNREFQTQWITLSKLIIIIVVVIVENLSVLSTAYLLMACSYWRLGYIENNVCTWVTNCFGAHERVIFVFIRNEGNKHKNNSQVSAETVLHESAYIIVFLTQHNESRNDDKNDDLYTSSLCLTRSVFVLLMMSQSIADNVTITRQLWYDHVNSDI